MGELPRLGWALVVRRRAAFWLLLLGAAHGSSAWAQVEPTPAAMIQRHGIPSETPTPPPPSPTPTPIPCDCDGNHVVSIAELIQAVRLLLSGDSADACGGFDGNRDDVLTVDELVVGVRHALYGCMALAVPDAVFDANVFLPNSDPFTPAVVRQDIGGALSLTIEYDVARAIQATGRFAPDGALQLEGTSIDLDVARPFTGSGEFRVIDDVYFLQAGFSGLDDDPNAIRLSRDMRGTPSTWGGNYEVTLAGDGVDSTFALTVHVPPSGFGECESPAAGTDGARTHVRSGPCLISPNGGFRFTTAQTSETSDIVLFGLLEQGGDAVSGHGTWGNRQDGQMRGTWTAVRPPG